MKKYHKQWAKLNDANQGIAFFIGEIDNYLQIGNGYLEFDILLRKKGANFNNVDADGSADEPISLIIDDFAYVLGIATPLSTNEKNEQNKYVGHVSTIMRLLASKDGVLKSYLDKIDDNQNGLKGSSLNEKLTANQEKVADRRNFEEHAPLEQFFGFCRTYKKN